MTDSENTVKKNGTLLHNIYKADCRSQFLKMLQQAYGPNIARLCGELDINAAEFFIIFDIIAEIQSSRKLLSVETQRYVFEGETNNVRKIVQANIERLSKQMKAIQRQICIGKRPQSTDDENNLSSSSSAPDKPSKRKRPNVGRKIKHKNQSSRNDESFSSGMYNTWSPVSIRELNNDEQIEHDTITEMRIDHFLKKYCGIQAVDISKTKILLMHGFKAHEEHLYEMMMHLRNKYSDTLIENIDKKNLVISLTKLLEGFKPVGYGQ